VNKLPSLGTHVSMLEHGGCYAPGIQSSWDYTPSIRFEWDEAKNLARPGLVLSHGQCHKLGEGTGFGR
jgi:hypothetical protein